MLLCVTQSCFELRLVGLGKVSLGYVRLGLFELECEKVMLKINYLSTL
jgi:hypothetical protein